MPGTAEVPHPIGAAHLPEAAAVFDAATALDTAMDRVDPQPTLVELLVSHVLPPREFLPQIGINSSLKPAWVDDRFVKGLSVLRCRSRGVDGVLNTDFE